MKYIVNGFDELIIDNDSRKQIFGINKINYWVKWEYDQYGEQIYREDSYGHINNLYNI